MVKAGQLCIGSFLFKLFKLHFGIPRLKCLNTNMCSVQYKNQYRKWKRLRFHLKVFPINQIRFFQPAREARRRASAQAVTSKWQLRTTSPMNTNSSEVKMGFRRKTGRSRAVYESIRKIPTGKTTEISVASQPSIRFFPLMARNGPFWPFFGP